MPKLSILVPIYNVERYLKECLDSLINQTFKDIEIICINDGSTDSSKEILDEYSSKDQRIKVINKNNTGYGDSMNIGLNEANGEYIGIVESDDFVKNTMFEDLFSIAKKNDSDIVKSDYFYYTTTDKQARKAGKIPKLLENKIINAKSHPILIKMQPSIWSAIYKKEFLEKNNIRFLETPGASYQDTSFSFKAFALASKVVLTNEAYLYYRQDNENSSIHSKEKVFIINKEYEEITEFLNNHPEIKRFINTTKLIKEYKTYMWNLARIDEKFREQFVDLFSSTFLKYYNAKEINKNFFKKVNKKEFEMLLFNKKLFVEYSSKIVERENNNKRRRKNFSIRINSSRISVILFGKQLIEVGT